MNTTLRAYAAIAGIIVMMALVLSQPAAAQTGAVTAEAAATAAVDTFYRLTECKAEFVDTETYLLYRPNAEAALERAAVELAPEDYFVLIYGQAIEKTHEIYGTPRVGQTLDAFCRSQDVYVEGIIGRVWVDIETGQPYHVAGSNRPRARLNCLAVMPGDALAQVEAHAAGTITPPSLVEVEDYTFAWYFRDDQTAHYIDARSGEYLSQEALGARLQEIQQTLAAMPEDAGGVTHCSLSPVFIEQGIHQNQHEGLVPGDGLLCGPTSLAMIFDYWGEEIDKLDVADAATPLGWGTTFLRLMHAGMFSHYSDALWDHDLQGPLQDGYRERPYGYSTAAEAFAMTGDAETDEQCAWNGLTELIQEHCPFIAYIPGHYVVIVGYAVDGEDEWVSIANPASPDLAWDDWDNSTWDAFKIGWLAACGYYAMVIRPLPVEMEFVPDLQQAGHFIIRATVRTCHEYPASVPVQGAAWNRVNLRSELKGNSDGSSENCPVEITYPNTAQLVSGSATQFFDPQARYDSDTFEWGFYVPPGAPRGGEFGVTVRGWAVDYSYDGSTPEEDWPPATDELFGWGVIRIDESLFRVRDGAGNTVAAIGDEGNVYLASALTEWCDSITATAEKELLVQSGGVNVARFGPAGTLNILRSCHGGMDDLNDTAWEVMPWTPWLLDEDITDTATQLWYTPYGAAWDLVYDFPFYIRIHDEILKATSFADQQPEGFTVVRAQEGTTAHAYDASAAITLYGRAALGEGVTSTATTLIFAEAEGEKFPLAFLSYSGYTYDPFPVELGLSDTPFYVKIDDEVLLVTDVTHSQQNETYAFTVVRGCAHTEPAAHAADSDVLLNLGEQFALSRVHGYWSNSDNNALKIKGPDSDVVAYIDSQGNLRHKGMVFENWTAWSYWD